MERVSSESFAYSLLDGSGTGGGARASGIRDADICRFSGRERLAESIKNSGRSLRMYASNDAWESCFETHLLWMAGAYSVAGACCGTGGAHDSGGGRY